MASNTQNMKENNIWIGDTGASCHMTNSLEGLSDLKKASFEVTMGDGKSMITTQVGKWTGVAIQKDGKAKPITLNKVAYVPKLCVNLFSITQVMKLGATLLSTALSICIQKGEVKIVFD